MKTVIADDVVMRNFLRIRDGFLNEAKKLEKEILEVDIDSNHGEQQQTYLTGQKEAYEKAAQKIVDELIKIPSEWEHL